MALTITTSNLNGIRAAKRKGFDHWAKAHTPNVWCMQETRAPQEIIADIYGELAADYVHAGKIASPEELHTLVDVCRIKGRAGVGMISDMPVLETRVGLPGLEEDVDSGRWIEADVRTEQGYVITVVCVYVHAGGLVDDPKEAQKYRFLDTMTERMQQLQDEAASGGRQAVVCGDFNIAHNPIDLKNPKSNENNNGYFPASAPIWTSGSTRWTTWM